MSVKEKILQDIKEAMKSKDEFVRDSLRSLSAAFKQVEVDERVEIEDERAFKIIASEIKKRNDAATLYKQGAREDLATKELKEAELFARYLPKQLSDDELEKELKALISTLHITSLKEQGLLMKEAKAKLGASVDGKRLNECVRKLLG